MLTDDCCVFSSVKLISHLPLCFVIYWHRCMTLLVVVLYLSFCFLTSCYMFSYALQGHRETDMDGGAVTWSAGLLMKQSPQRFNLETLNQDTHRICLPHWFVKKCRDLQSLVPICWFDCLLQA